MRFLPRSRAADPREAMVNTIESRISDGTLTKPDLAKIQGELKKQLAKLDDPAAVRELAANTKAAIIGVPTGGKHYDKLKADGLTLGAGLPRATIERTVSKFIQKEISRAIDEVRDKRLNQLGGSQAVADARAAFGARFEYD